MYKILSVFFLSLFIFFSAYSQQTRNKEARHWADSVFYSLTDDQRIAQLMVLRESSFSKDGPIYYDSLIEDAIKKYDIGGIVLFQGTPVMQAKYINYFQSISKTPLMVCIDGEWGLGMRLDSVIPLNYQMMLGAVNDTSVIAAYGNLVGRQCRREGIQVNFAPVVDINNNPDNPVINFRSFGENKYKVALYGVTYMKALQRNGILACAKHFPGHGDVSVDSHLDLPVINKSMQQLDTLELYPFKQMFAAGVGSVMIAHLYIPAIDSTPNTATSLSKNNVTGLLRNKLHFNGLTFTDALGMKGVAKYFPGGDIAAQSLIAGNDMLCLPEDVATSIAKIREAILANKLSWSDIYAKCRKVLEYKYLYGVANAKPVDTTNLVSDLNAGANDIRKIVAENALTVLNNRDKEFFPLTDENKQIAYIGIGIDSANTFADRLKNDLKADAFYFDYKEGKERILSTAELIKQRYQAVVIGIHNYNRYPANQFGISDNALDLISQVQQNNKTIIFDFGNPYALKNFCNASNLIACYEDDSVTQNAAADILEGKIIAKGTLPVTVCSDYKYGSGILSKRVMPLATPAEEGLNGLQMEHDIDSIASLGITGEAYPGCVVLIARHGKIVFEKAYGKYNYDTPEPVSLNSIYDMASVTKICATTLGVMKLYSEGKLRLDKTLGTYLPWVRKSDKKNLNIKNILLHQAGLVADVVFYKKTVDPVTGQPLPRYFRPDSSAEFNVRVAQHLYLRRDYADSMNQSILDSKLLPGNKYVYSDNDFILMADVVRAISGLRIDKYVNKYFYKPMGLHSIGFNPRNRFDTDLVAPTELDQYFRFQHLHADVHDEGSAMFGGDAGHAGLFSNAEDIAAILQMFLNGGSFKGKQYIKPSTLKLFTAYNSGISRRGIGFDKPEKDNYTTTDPHPYPSRFASPLTFGHTGYTGTCIWVDPKYDLVYVFLSNRVNPSRSTNLYKYNIRGAIQDAVYKAMVPAIPEVVGREKFEEAQQADKK
ncbi:MAG TPA: glycoside hydrolase family 3 N-terminal domain-containing protein [Chitinophagaceae bacterium]|nr:glycoside hydrolase family 3 N-terminal domain-containing protein [Chitinophagaceae bacterium]